MAPSISIALSGKPLRYLIGTDASGPGRDNEVTVVSYSTARPAKHGISIAYCNLFDEHNTGKYGPYLNTSDTAAQYNEGQIDPRGPGWEKNLREQFERRKKQGFEYVELDNPDAYTIKDVIGAIELASSYGLKVIAKNPGLMGNGAAAYVAHPNVYGIIVEKRRRHRKADGRSAPRGRQARAADLVRRLRLRAQVGGQRRQHRQELPQHGRDLFERRRIPQRDRYSPA